MLINGIAPDISLGTILRGSLPYVLCMVLAIIVLTIFPQIVSGSWIALSERDLYPFYDLCGRIYPELGPQYDQTVGGLIIWIPPGMMGILGLVLVLNNLRKVAEKDSVNDSEDQDGGIVIDSSQWTG